MSNLKADGTNSNVVDFSSRQWGDINIIIYSHSFKYMRAIKGDVRVTSGFGMHP